MSEDCPKCEGREIKPWAMEEMCEEHDRCIMCEIKRVDMDDAPWQKRLGIQCRPCREKEIKNQIEAFQKKLEEEGDSILDFASEPICPYCGHEQSDAWEIGDGTEEIDCGNCHQAMTFERDVEVTYTTGKKEPK